MGFIKEKGKNTFISKNERNFKYTVDGKVDGYTFFCFKELFLCFLHPSKIKQLFCSYENYAITFLYDVVIRVAHNLFHNMHKNHDKRIPTLKGKARSTNTYLNFFNFQSRIK